MAMILKLISHNLCPYVQRAAILFAEKNISYEKVTIDLANKPDWFLEISPLGKTPVLIVDETTVLFESAAICEFLEESYSPKLHPISALERAQHRAWIEYSSAILNSIAALYNAPTESDLVAQAHRIDNQFAWLETHLDIGPFFSGEQFSLVDAAFGPVFRYFDVIDDLLPFNIFEGKPKISNWRYSLSRRPSVISAVSSDYALNLQRFVINKRSALAIRLLGGQKI